MFFSIAKQAKENFPNHYTLGKLVVNTDNGWHTYSYSSWEVVYKGYADNGYLSLLLNNILSQDVPTELGNFCVIAYNTQTQEIRIKTDLYRSFPIFYTQGIEVTNLIPLEYTVYTDNIISIDKNLQVEYPLKSNFDIVGNIDSTTLSIDQVIDAIDKILTRRTQNFIKFNSLPMRVHLTGGMDTMLIYSYLQKYTTNYEIITAQHFDYDYFYLMNTESLHLFWGYKQLHHWRESCVLMSGSSGDEFMLRGPATADLFLKDHNIEISKLLDLPVWKDCLHQTYFKKSKNQKIFQQPKSNMHGSELVQHLCNITVNDWQHWHLGNTLTWAPLRDLEIFKLLLRLDPLILVEQVMSATITKQLIKNNNPKLLSLTSDQKNSTTAMKNLVDFCGFNPNV